MAGELTLEACRARGIDEALAARILPQVNPLLASLPAAECWREISRHLLAPEHPFALHQLLYQSAYAGWSAAQGPPPAWFPSAERIDRANITALRRALNLSSYPELHAWSAAHRAAFWEEMIARLEIRLVEPWEKILDLGRGPEAPQWLAGARLNIAESCFAAPAEAPAIVYQPEGEALATWSYGELRAQSARVAASLRARGFLSGEAIAIDMPMSAESVAIYLGIVLAGCVVVSIADSFAAGEVQTRLRLSRARAVFTQDFIRRGGRQLPLYEKVAGAAHCVVLGCDQAARPSASLRAGDLSWGRFLGADDRFAACARRPSQPTNILFSSGTTGEPKVIPWTQTAPIKCAADGHLHHNIQPGDVVAWPTNLGWMMGPWLIYATLVNRATMALYYGAPTGRAFGRFVQDAGVTMLGVVPSMVRTWAASDCMRGLDWSALELYSSTGECSRAEDMLFLMSRVPGYRPVIEYCGGTEIAGGYLTGTVVQPAAPATFTTPALGLDFVLLDAEGQSSEQGEVFLLPPSMGLSAELLNRDHHEVYFAGTPPGPGGVPLRRHGDRIERLPGGYFRAHGRVDDTMNLGGIKVSSAEIERVLNGREAIEETAAIAVPPPGGGPSRLVIYAVLEEGSECTKEALRAALQEALRRHLNPLFKIHDLVVVDTLPRTASNKIVRRLLREQYGKRL